MTDFSFQLYSARNFPPVDAILPKLARLGYTQVEAYSGLFGDPKGLAAMVKADNQRATAQQLAFAKAMKEQAAKRASLKPLLAGKPAYLLAVSRGLVDMPDSLHASDTAVDQWKKRFAVGKN